MPPPGGLQTAKPLPPETITSRGVVLDGSLNVPVAGAFVFVNGTKYGAVTNQKGAFSFSFAPDWPLARTGEMLLEISAGHFASRRQLVTVSFRKNPRQHP